MTISHLLQDFGSANPEADDSRLITEEEIEDIRLGAFEQGYSAGWEDAAKAQTAEMKRVSVALTASLEDISFPYHEAVNQMTLAMEPVFRALVSTFLPEVMAATFGDHILEQIRAMAHDHLDHPVQLAVPKGTAAAVEELLSSELSLPVEIVEDPSLDGGQALVRIGDEEREVDCSALIAAFREAVAAFFYQSAQEANNG
ncbi:MAG: ABC transporter ATP-binding protein [Pseudooceanicola sp.]|nr:ABC transporter ATP-binding protein [Pseudooceanicola sp.]